MRGSPTAKTIPKIATITNKVTAIDFNAILIISPYIFIILKNRLSDQAFFSLLNELAWFGVKFIRFRNG